MTAAACISHTDWPFDEHDYTNAIDALWHRDDFLEALSADLSEAQGQVIDADQVTSDAYELVWQAGSSDSERLRNHKELSYLLARAIHFAGRLSGQFIAHELELIESHHRQPSE